MEGSGRLDKDPPVRVHTLEKSRKSRSRDVTPMIDVEEGTSREKNYSPHFEEESVTLTKYEKRLNEDDTKISTRENSIKDKVEQKNFQPSSAQSSDDDDFSSMSKLKDSSSSKQQSLPAHKNLMINRGSSLTRTVDLYDEEDDDDDDLEEFLLKQRERTRKLKDDGDTFEPISARKSPSKRSTVPTGDSETEVETKSDKYLAKDNDGDDNIQQSMSSMSVENETAKQRRKRQRRRTIEQLTSPEHKSAKTNGV